MLNGLDPVIIFQFSFLAGDVATNIIKKVPIISTVPTLIEQPPIPIYLSEQRTGLFINSETKVVDIGTQTETFTDGKKPEVIQKGASSTVTVELIAKRDSIALTLLSSMIDLIFDKVTSKQYAITYMHGPTTIFRGLLSSYSVNPISGTDTISISFELTRGDQEPDKKKADIPDVSAQPQLPLNG